MSWVCTSLTRDGRDRSSSRGLQDQDVIDYNTPTVRMNPIHGIYNTCDVSTLKGTCPQFLYAPRLFSFSGSIWRLFVPHDPKGSFSDTLRRLWPRPYLWQNQPELHRLKYASPYRKATSYFKWYKTIGLSGNVPINHRTQDPTRYLT
jgi:hypothetical protein